VSILRISGGVAALPPFEDECGQQTLGQALIACYIVNADLKAAAADIRQELTNIFPDRCHRNVFKAIFLKAFQGLAGQLLNENPIDPVDGIVIQQRRRKKLAAQLHQIMAPVRSITSDQFLIGIPLLQSAGTAPEVFQASKQL